MYFDTSFHHIVIKNQIYEKKFNIILDHIRFN